MSLCGTLSGQSLAGFYGGTHVLCGIYATGWTRGKPWVAQSSEAQQLNRTDRQTDNYSH